MERNRQALYERWTKDTDVMMSAIVLTKRVMQDWGPQKVAA
jgi:hypothetical protein